MIIQIVLYFLVAAAISFVGSLQPGPVNLSVIGASSAGRYKYAFYLAIGGSLPEALFALIALLASSVLAGYQGKLSYLSNLFAVVFILIGFWLIFSKQKAKQRTQNSGKSGLGLGLMLSILNPQLVFFWVAVITWLNLHHLAISTSSAFSQMGFVLGTSTGAFVLHLFLIAVCRRFQHTEWMQLFARYSNKIAGTILLMTGLFDWIL